MTLKKFLMSKADDFVLQSGDDIPGRLNGIFSETEAKESKIYAWIDLHSCQIQEKAA